MGVRSARPGRRHAGWLRKSGGPDRAVSHPRNERTGKKLARQRRSAAATEAKRGLPARRYRTRSVRAALIARRLPLCSQWRVQWIAAALYELFTASTDKVSRSREPSNPYCPSPHFARFPTKCVCGGDVVGIFPSLERILSSQECVVPAPGIAIAEPD